MFWDLYYVCIDTFSLDALIEQSEAFGLERTSLSSFYVSWVELMSIQKKLNWTFRVHGGILAGDIVLGEDAHGSITMAL
jgi:hypothetical protein